MTDKEHIEALNRLWERVEPRLHPEMPTEAIPFPLSAPVSPPVSTLPASAPSSVSTPPAVVPYGTLLEKETLLYACYARMLCATPRRRIRRESRDLFASQEAWGRRLAGALFLRYGLEPREPNDVGEGFPHILRACYGLETELCGVYKAGISESTGLTALWKEGLEHKQGHLDALAALAEAWI